MRSLEAWALRRATRGVDRGQLVWIGDDGVPEVIGQFTREDLTSLAWAWRVAYRMSRSRDERSRLARSRDAASRLARAGERRTRNA